jgi:hypothetical protein
MRSKVARFCDCWFVVAGVLMISSAASAQVAGGGSIEGTVTDPSGGIVPEAQVTATNNATGVQTTRLTKESTDNEK